MRPTRLLFLVTAIATLLAMPAAALAYAPTGDDFITCAIDDGDDVDCEAGEFDPDSEVEWQSEYNPVIATGTATANADGTASFSFNASEVPDGSEIVVTVEGTFDGEAKVLADTVAVVEDGEIIPRTGANSLGLVGIALGALALGAGLLILGRKRRSIEA